MAFFKSLFKQKQIIRQKKSFNSPIIRNSGVGASWVSFNSIKTYIQYFNELPEIYLAVNKQAQAFNRFNLNIYSKRGKLIDNHPLQQRLKNPNKIHNKTEFFKASYFSLIVAGFFVWRKGSAPIGFENSVLSNEYDRDLYLIPPQVIQYQLKTNINYENVSNYMDIFDRLYYQINGTEIDLLDENTIIGSNVGLGNAVNFFLGDSPISKLLYPISNLYKIYEGDNVVLKRLGALGIYTIDISGELAELNSELDEDQRKQLERELPSYGIGDHQKNNLVTTAPIKYQSTIPDIEKLQFIPKSHEYAKTIAKTIGTPPILLSLDDSTFSNQESASIQMYQDVVIPNAKIFEDALSVAYGIKENGETIEFDYSHIEVLQADEKLKAETANLKSDIIIKLNTAVNSGTMSRDAAVQFAVNELDVSESMAELLIIENPTQTNETTENE